MKFKILIYKNTPTLGIFRIYKIKSGLGITIGNTLRRILLSSLFGYSISYFKIKGVLHEFSYIKGIIEDVPNIILNLKQIRFKLKKGFNVEKEKVDIKIINKNNKIYAKDFQKFIKNFYIVNKDLVICNKDESKIFKIKLIIDKGIGYIQSDKKKYIKNYIAIDSIYSPIKNVSFKILKITNDIYKEILNLNIVTDNTISPLESLIKSSKILIDIFSNFTLNINYLIQKK
ncbi:MAG: DNA-directed RNA polymerase subunit alpha [Candidatus Shikimatogenerans bostrichidophilus]|nr:MAG: DNA-directed RNA polymerase subunit alpha [Candidatus Shikimatogenerans bostrichidophilus]